MGISLPYRGGYPNFDRSFTVLIKRKENYIIFAKQLSGKEQFRINIDDILNIKFNEYEKSIIMQIKQNNNTFNILIEGRTICKKDYEKIMFLVHSDIKDVNSKNKKTIVAFIAALVFIMMFVINLTPSKNVTNSKPANVQTSKPKVDNANLQTDLRDKLKDNAIQVEDSTDSTGYILIKNKCQADTRSRISYETYLMLNEARQRPEYKKCNKIGVMITADLTDKYGNNSNNKVYMQDFDKSELDKVNWDNIDESKMDVIGETPWYHGIINLDK